MLCLFFRGLSCKGDDGPVTSLESIAVIPEKKVGRKEHEIDKSWEEHTRLDKLGCCDLQYNEQNNRDKTVTMSLNNNMSAVWSIEMDANSHSIQQKSTYL